MKRWITRSFFIGLLLLCMGGWVSSPYYGFGVRHTSVVTPGSPVHIWRLRTNEEGVNLSISTMENHQLMTRRGYWSYKIERNSHVAVPPDSGENRSHFLGFA